MLKEIIFLWTLYNPIYAKYMEVLSAFVIDRQITTLQTYRLLGNYGFNFSFFIRCLLHHYMIITKQEGNGVFQGACVVFRHTPPCFIANLPNTLENS